MKVKCVRDDFDPDAIPNPPPRHWWPVRGQIYNVVNVVIPAQNVHWPNGATLGFELAEIPHRPGFDHRAFVGVW